MEMTKSISSLDVSRLIRNKRDLYDAVSRNSFFLPPCSDSFVSADFLDGVRRGVNWLPKTDQCKLFQCADPPPKSVLAELLYFAMTKWIMERNFSEAERQTYLNTAERVRKHPPNR